MEAAMSKLFSLMLCVAGLMLSFCSDIALSSPKHQPSYYFPSHRTATGKRVFIFDPKQHAWAAYNEAGERVREGRASGGAAYCPDIHRACRTVVGSFQVISKKGASCVSSRYPIKTRGGAETPYCMHFHKKGYAVHGSYDVPANRNASHGCIRVTPEAARWLNQDFLKIGSTVIVAPYK